MGAKPFPTIEEIGDLFEYLLRERLASWEGGELHALMLVACTTRIRSAVALRLRVEDFDFEAANVSVPAGRVLYLPAHLPTPIAPKASKVDLFGFTIPHLREWSTRCGSGLMFPGKEKSAAWSSGAFRRSLDAAAVVAGLPAGTTIEGVMDRLLADRMGSLIGDAASGRHPILRIYGEPDAGER